MSGDKEPDSLYLKDFLEYFWSNVKHDSVWGKKHKLTVFG